MKKFLFTLAALLLAGSAFANQENYLYFDDITVTATDLDANGCIDVPLKAHFDNYVSAWNVWITCPEGVTVDWMELGEDATVSYYNGRGQVKSLLAGISQAPDDPAHLIATTSATVVSYWQNPETSAWESCYAVKWLPGDYDEMCVISLKFADDFDYDTPCQITVKTDPASGQDPRGEVALSGGEYVREITSWINKKDEVTLEVPTIAVAGDGTLEATVTITNPNENGTIMYSLDNENWTAYTEPLTYDVAGNYHIYAKVVDGENESAVADEEFTVREETTAPEPEFAVRDGKLYAEKEGYTVNLQMKNGEGQWVDVANPYELPAQGNEAQTIEFQAQTVKNTEDNNSAWTPYSVTIPALPTLGGYFVWTQQGDQFQVVYHNTDLEEQGVVFTLKVYDANGNEVQPMDDFYGPLPEGTSNWSATVTAEGYQPKSDTHEFTYHTPTYAPEPKFNWDAETLTMTAYVEGDDSYTVVLMANGTEVSNPKTYEQTYEEQRINFTAYTVKKDEDNNSATVAFGSNPVVIPAKELTASDPAEFNVVPYDTYVEVYATGPNVVLLDENGQEVDQPYVIARPEYDPEGSANTYVPVSAVTKNDDTDEVHYKPTTTNYTVTVPMQAAPVIEDQDLTGELVFTAVDMEGTDGGKFTVEYVGDEEGVTVTVVSMVEKTRDGEYQLPDYGTYTVTAKASKAGYKDMTDTHEFTWTRLAADPAAVLSQIPSPTDVTVTVAGNNVELFEDEDCTVPMANPFTETRPAYGEENKVVTVYAKTSGEGVEDTVTPLNVTIPAQQPTPGIDVDKTPMDQWIPGATDPTDPTTDPGSTLQHGYEYVLTFDVPEGYADKVHYTINDGEEMVWDGQPIILTGDNADIVAWVVVDNDKSPEAEKVVELPNNFTGVNELISGKAVAGVRYFNMAGQEMQEANGVTIVVTTYTDGTTSAVKVIK